MEIIVSQYYGDDFVNLDSERQMGSLCSMWSSILPAFSLSSSTVSTEQIPPTFQDLIQISLILWSLHNLAKEC
jgi:hypothetical protein